MDLNTIQILECVRSKHDIFEWCILYNSKIKWLLGNIPARNMPKEIIKIICNCLIDFIVDKQGVVNHTIIKIDGQLMIDKIEKIEDGVTFKIGNLTTWYENGQLCEQKTFNFGGAKIMTTSYNSNGKQKEYHNIHYPNENKKKIVNMVDKSSKSWYESGQVKTAKLYRTGGFTPSITRWNENGDRVYDRDSYGNRYPDSSSHDHVSAGGSIQFY